MEADSSITLRTVLDQNLRKNYFKFDKQFTTQNGYGYKVSVLDGNRNVIVESDTIGANPTECWECGPNWILQCYWTCNGPSYAYSLGWYSPAGEPYGRLIPEPAYALSDPVNQLAIPYYEAMSADVFTMRQNNGNETWWDFDILENRGHEVLYNVGPGDQIYDSQNTLLFDTDVHFVGKTMEGYYGVMAGSDYSVDFSDFSGLPTDQIAPGGGSCGQYMVWALSMYNQEGYHSNYPLPEIPGTSMNQTLSCISANQVFQGDVDFDDYPLLNFIIECNGQLYEASELNLGEVLAGLPCGSDGVWITLDDVDVDNDGPTLEDIVLHQVSVKGDPPVNIDPEDVFDSGDPFIANNDFESGLYKVQFVYSNGTIIPLIVEHDAENSASAILNSDFAALTVAPNPITSDFLDFKLEVERRMVIDVKVLALDGSILHTERRDLDANTELKRSLKIPEGQYPYQQLVVKVVFEDGSSIEEIALRPQQ